MGSESPTVQTVLYIYMYILHTCRTTHSKQKRAREIPNKLQFLPYGRSIGSWICLTQNVYMSHGTEYDTILYDIIFTGMKVGITIFERVTMYNNAKRTLRKLQKFISTVILL
jgi:hypothetical protein